MKARIGRAFYWLGMAAFTYMVFQWVLGVYRQIL